MDTNEERVAEIVASRGKSKRSMQKSAPKQPPVQNPMQNVACEVPPEGNLPHRWTPEEAAEIGKTGGRPCLRDELLAMLAEVDPKRSGKRKTRVLAESLYELACRGSIQAHHEIWDRLEGAPKQTFEVNLHDLTDADLRAKLAEAAAERARIEQELAGIAAASSGD